MNRLLVVLTLSWIASGAAWAAPGYVRFEGTVYSAWQSPNQAASLAAGQSVYFDFQFDTALQAPGYNDRQYQDYFAATYLAGSVAPQFAYGHTNNHPEGYLSAFHLPAYQLTVGVPFSSINQEPWFHDKSIATWYVGQYMGVLDGSTTGSQIGYLSLTYLGDAPPPAMVPLPPAIALLASAIGGLGFLRRRTDSR